MEKTESTTPETLIEKIDEQPVVPGEFKIVVDNKRIMKKSVSGQTIEALKRAKAPLALNALAARVFTTKVGKTLSVKDNKARVKKCAEWYANDENGHVIKNEKGEYSLARVPA